MLYYLLKEYDENYDIKNTQPIKKEWDEQMVAFEVFAIDKTVADLTGLKLVDGVLDDSEDLKSSVTMTVDEYISVVKKASDSAQNLK